jgi:hypothetical protein
MENNFLVKAKKLRIYWWAWCWPCSVIAIWPDACWSHLRNVAKEFAKVYRQQISVEPLHVASPADGAQGGGFEGLLRLIPKSAANNELQDGMSTKLLLFQGEIFMKKNRWIIGMVSATWIVMLALNVYAADGIRKVPVQFKKDASQASIKGHIKGRETIDYVLRAQAGQTMTVNLKTSSTAAYFNVLPSDSSDAAIFIGQVAGGKFEGKLAKDGDYTIRVYLIPVAARRNESAKYTLTVKVTG